VLLRGVNVSDAGGRQRRGDLLSDFDEETAGRSGMGGASVSEFEGRAGEMKESRQFGAQFQLQSAFLI
jgi:hypothetical protein